MHREYRLFTVMKLKSNWNETEQIYDYILRLKLELE